MQLFKAVLALAIVSLAVFAEEWKRRVQVHTTLMYRAEHTSHGIHDSERSAPPIITYWNAKYHFTATTSILKALADQAQFDPHLQTPFHSFARLDAFESAVAAFPGFKPHRDYNFVFHFRGGNAYNLAGAIESALLSQDKHGYMDLLGRQPLVFLLRELAIMANKDRMWRRVTRTTMVDGKPLPHFRDRPWNDEEVPLSPKASVLGVMLVQRDDPSTDRLFVHLVRMPLVVLGAQPEMDDADTPTMPEQEITMSIKTYEVDHEYLSNHAIRLAMQMGKTNVGECYNFFKSHEPTRMWVIYHGSEVGRLLMNNQKGSLLPWPLSFLLPYD